MSNHKRCPECDSHDTSREWIEWHRDMVEEVRICEDCPTQWTVGYGDPHVKDVIQYE